MEILTRLPRLDSTKKRRNLCELVGLTQEAEALAIEWARLERKPIYLK